MIIYLIPSVGQDICDYAFNFVTCLDTKMDQALLYRMKSLAADIMLPKEPLKNFFETGSGNVESRALSQSDPNNPQEPRTQFKELTPVPESNQIENTTTTVPKNESFEQPGSEPQPQNLTNQTQDIQAKSLPVPLVPNITSEQLNSEDNPSNLPINNQTDLNQTLANDTVLKSSPGFGPEASQNTSGLSPIVRNNQTQNSSQPIHQNVTDLGHYRLANESDIQPRNLRGPINIVPQQSQNFTNQSVSNIMKIPPRSVNGSPPIINSQVNNSSTENLQQLANVAFGGAQLNSTGQLPVNESSLLNVKNQVLANQTLA